VLDEPINSPTTTGEIVKTSRTLLQAAAGLFATSLIAVVTLAGPGPQYFNRTTAQPAPKPAAAPKTEPPVAGKCDACKTTTTWAIGDRGPAGKGAPGASITARSHECGRCSGTIDVAKATAKNSMTHAAACATMVCCTSVLAPLPLFCRTKF